MGTTLAAAMDRPTARAATPPRPFRVLDAMILVAATAIGCGWLQLSCDESKTNPAKIFWKTFVRPADSLLDLAVRPIGLAPLVMPFLTVGLLAILPLQLLGPRPPFRRLVRQPGLMTAFASATVIGLLGFLLVIEASTAKTDRDSVGKALALADFFEVPMLGGLAIFVSWVTLLLSRRWRAEPTWVDRLGRVLGITWVVFGAVVWLGWTFDDAVWSHCAARSIRSMGTSSRAVVGQEIERVVDLTMPFVAVGTLLSVPLHWLGRRRLRGIVRRPGFLAACAWGLAAAVLELPAIAWPSLLSVRWEDPWEALLSEDNAGAVVMVGGFAVFVSWATLLLARRWRAAPSWADRLGRAMGMLWIAGAIALMVAGVLIQTG